MRRLWLVLLLSPVLLGGPGALAQGGHVMLLPDEIAWVPASPSLPPGALVAIIEGKPSEPGPFTMRLKFPAGYRIAPHSHPAIEHVTVLSGTLRFGMGDTFDRANLKAMTAGSFIVMPTGTNHFVDTNESTVIQVHGVGPWGVTYANPADDPSKK